jgi:hypothetical protein
MQISNLMKIRPLGAELFHAGGRAGGQTDVSKPIATFCNFAKASENSFVNAVSLFLNIT